MKSKHVEKINKLIEEYGEPETAKKLGVSLPELYVITKNEVDEYMAGELIYHLLSMDKLPKKYNGFEIYLDDFAGTVVWSRTTLIEVNKKSCIEESIFYATPFWDGNEGIPIDSSYYQVYNTKYNEGTIKETYFSDTVIYNEMLPSDTIFSNIEELIVWYRDFYLPKTYEVIMNMLEKIRLVTKKEVIEAIDKES